jgi:hypothetical protein
LHYCILVAFNSQNEPMKFFGILLSNAEKLNRL